MSNPPFNDSDTASRSSAFLQTGGTLQVMAEIQDRRKIPMTMEDWEKRLSGFLQLWDREILRDAGKVSAELANAHAESEFEKYRIVQDRLFESDFDQMIKKLPPKGDAL